MRWLSASHCTAPERLRQRPLVQKTIRSLGAGTCLLTDRITQETFQETGILQVVMAQMVKICLQCRRPGLDPWVGTLAWRIPRTEKPGGLQSMGWQRVRRDWVTDTFLLFTWLQPSKLRTVRGSTARAAPRASPPRPPQQRPPCPLPAPEGLPALALLP